MYAKVIEAPVPTSAYTTGHCPLPGRPFLVNIDSNVDAQGHMAASTASRNSS
jgi:hypothetical protein